MEIIFLPPAKAELTDATSYYNMQSEGLGYEFAAEVKRTLERIVQYPDAWFKLSKTPRVPLGSPPILAASASRFPACSSVIMNST